MTTALKRLVFSAFLVGGGSFAIFHLHGPEGLPGLKRKWDDITQRRERILELKRQIEQQKIKNESLKHDEEMQRLLIEEQLRVAPKGHKIYRLPPKAKPADSDESPQPRE